MILATVGMFLMGSLQAPVVTVPPGTHDPKIAEWATRFQKLATRPDRDKLTLRFLPGRHRFVDTLNVKGANIVIEGAPGAILAGGPLLSAGRAVIDAALRDRLPEGARPHVREFRLQPYGISKPGGYSERGFGLPTGTAPLEIFVDGKPQRPARFPNVDDDNAGWSLIGEVKAPNEFITAEVERIKTWKSLDDVWAYGYWMFDWAECWQKVAGFEPATGKLTLQAATAGPLKNYGIGKGRRMFFANVLEELDQPGEVWIDQGGNRVLAWLPEGARAVEASDLAGPFLDLQGAKDITVRNLRFQAGRGDGIHIQNSENCVLENVEIRNLGALGVSISGGKNCGVRDSLIEDLGAGGVLLNGGDRLTLAKGGHFVENSTIRRIARLTRTYRTCVNLEGVGNRVSGNTFTDTPHTAVHFTGNDHLIELNDIRRVCTETADSGAIYSGRNPTYRGNVIRWNRFREIEAKAKTEGNLHFVICIYLDDCLPGTSVIGNLIESPCIGMMLGGGRDTIVEGNVFLGTDMAISFDQRAKGWAKSHFEGGWRFLALLDEVPVLGDVWAKHYPKLAADVKAKADMTLAQGNTLRGNVCAGPEFVRYLDGLTDASWAVFENNHVQKPTLMNHEALTRVSSISKPIPVERIGARPRKPLP